MSRFEVKHDEIGKITVSESSLNNLVSELSAAYNSYLHNIANETMKNMAITGCEYRLITVHDYVISIKKNEQPAAEMSVGYPFPIYNTSLKVDWLFPFKCQFFIRGKLLRNAQRDYLLEYLNNNSRSCKVIQTESLEYFFDLCENSILSELSGESKLYYFDFYHFIGDSILSMYMLNTFINHFNVKPSDVVVYSRHESHLPISYEKHNYTQLGTENSFNGIIILPSLLDIDARDAITVLSKVQSGVCLFFSRNDIIIRRRNTDMFLSLSVDDILLRKQNIYDYMNECIYPFTHDVIQTTSVNSSDTITRIFLNPNASTPDKSLSDALLSSILNSFPNIDFLVPEGFDDSSIRRASLCAQYDNVLLVKTFNISDLVIYAQKTDLIISPDTSVAHACVQLGLRCITVFYEGFWDKESLQSLSAESPIGFCSPSRNQLPIVVNQQNETMVIDLIMYCYSSTMADFNLWDNGLRSLSMNFSGIERENIDRIIERLSLKHKLLS